ncbi:hypothetical protein B0H67DRAFT_595911 [Lasiosphaeris hirsuta]|uniref:DUF6604 domain-containing protein n=1 Tax=Lasiosphaeris hirsuta TaxID=260670 RepID=A0AA40B8I2_9PEZI|nr:hypothetical protein B0H67DRAFT_595911 [Lasiosphaeris hirsuta]
MDPGGKLNGLGTWRRYKLGQAQFTSWLKQTAEKVVANNPPEPDAQPNESANSAQQQSRRQKKGKAKTSATALNLDPDNAQSVHWSELEVLAQRVADHANPDEIPDAPLNILRGVVGLRKKSFRFFSNATEGSSNDKLNQSNANHAHIISVLERVLAKLEGLVSAATSRAPKKESKENNTRIDISDLGNMFTYLDVQPAANGADESDQSGEEGGANSASKKARKSGKKKGAKKVHKMAKTQKPQPAQNIAGNGNNAGSSRDDAGSWIDEIDFVEYMGGEEELQNDELDLYMMVYCFFDDFNIIRSYVAERWCDYWYHQSVPLGTLAVITNAAFELLDYLERDLIWELRGTNPELSKYEFMMEMLFINFGLDHVDYDSYEGLSEEEKNERISRDEADWVAFSAYCAIKRTLERIPPFKIPMLPPSDRTPIVYGAHDLDTWRVFESRVTMQLFLETAHLKALKTNGQEEPILPAEPELLLDLEDCLRSYRYSSALVFSLQIWVDIRNIMETEVSRPFEQLQVTAARLKEALETHTCNPKDRDFRQLWNRRIREVSRYMLEDFTFKDKKERFLKMGVSEDPESFFLLQNDPVWSGLLDVRAKLVQSQMGHQFAMSSTVLEAAAYLYSAATVSDPNLPAWDEMRTYMNTYGEGTIAIRKILYDRYAWEVLDSSQMPWYLGEIIKHRLQVDRANLAIGQPYCNCTTCSKEHAAGENCTSNSNTSSTTDTGIAALTKNSPTPTKLDEEKERQLRRKATLSRLSPLEMLQVLDDTITSQLEGLLTFDYFQLFDDSLAFLAALNDAYGAGMQARVGHKVDDKTYPIGQLPVHLAEVLAEADGSPARASLLDVLVRVCGEFATGLGARATSRA